MTCGTMGMPTATIKLSNADGEDFVQPAIGTGPIDAAFKAIDAIVKAPNSLLEYSVHSVTEGIDAVGEVTVRISPVGEKRSFGGYGADDDIVVASIKAYVAALNRMIAVLGFGDIQPEGDVAIVGVGD